MNKLIEQLKRHEGLKLKPYKCPAGKLTIGYGRNIEDNGISLYEAEEMLENDIYACDKELLKFEWYSKIDETARKAVLINMCFNLGLPRLLKFVNMINALSVYDYGLAAKEMLDSKWADQVGDRAVELAMQMKTGVYSDR